MENFLDKKYADLAGSRPVQRAADHLKQEGQKTPYTRVERITAYLDRLDKIITHPRAFRLLKQSVLERYVTKPEEIPQSYWDSQEQELRNRGQGADWGAIQLDKKEELKKHHAKTILADQRSSLEEWVDYFGSSDSDYVPKALKYWIFRNVLNLQELVKKKDEKKEYVEFPKRSRGTVKSFPNLNQEALAYVIDALKNKFSGEKVVFEHDIQPDERDAFNEYLNKEDFAKLYAWSNELMKSIPDHLLPITEGKWVKYDQGSDPQLLVQTIRGKGTGWCTAGLSTATEQLQGGDFYVYYTLDDDGQPTLPRLAIRMKGHDQIAEDPRGIAYKQNIDKYIGPVLEDKLKEFGKIGEKYKKKSADMNWLTDIENKAEKGEELTKEDLAFLYEKNENIEGFGYRQDPRIAEIRARRDPRKDAPIVFECDAGEIAWNRHEVSTHTKAYIGPLFSGIFKSFSNLEYIYTSFPEGKITKDKVVIGTQDRQQLLQALEEQEIHLRSYGRQMIESPSFTFTQNRWNFIERLLRGETKKTAETVDIVRLKVRDLGFSDNPTTTQLFSKAKELGLELCPAEVGPYYRLQYTNQPMNEWFYIGMKPLVAAGNLTIFGLEHREDGLWLSNLWAPTDDDWDLEKEFVFRCRKSNASNVTS